MKQLEIPNVNLNNPIPSMSSLFTVEYDLKQSLTDEPSGASAKFWRDTFENYKRIPKNDYDARGELLVHAINEMSSKFGEDGHFALRRAYNQLGLNFERSAANKGELLLAAQCYIYADQLFGMWTDYALRAINCFGEAGEIGIAQVLSNQLYGDTGPIVMQTNM